MKRYSTPKFICILYTLILGVTAFLLLTAVHAGEFGGTFNSRLACKRSSWHEGKVVGINHWFITVDVSKDLLRHTKTKRFRVGNHDDDYSALKKGDIVLINFHKKHPTYTNEHDYNTCASSIMRGSPLMGIIDPIKKDVRSFKSGGYSSPILTWFYHTKRLGCTGRFHIGKEAERQYMVCQASEWKEILNL